MTAKNVWNVTASVKQKLLNKSRTEERSFEELVRRYAMERFLYRLSQSKYRDRLILKGALMFAVWKNSIYRPTLDIDMLGRLSNDTALLENAIREICSVNIEDDGIRFYASTVKSDAITKDADYAGRRVRFVGKMENMRISMQIDIGFGDAVFPEPDEITMPSFFDMPTGKILGYTRESAIAEKYHAMIQMAELNSRMKDFYDIWILTTSFDFVGQRISQAMKLTFEKRQISISNEVVAFSDSFAKDKQDQWQVFRKKVKAMESPVNFADVTKQVEKFLRPIITSLAQNSAIPGTWKAPDHWEQ